MFKKKVAHLQAQIRQSAATAGVINQPHGRPPKSPKNAAAPRGGHHGSWGRQLCHLHGQNMVLPWKLEISPEILEPYREQWWLYFQNTIRRSSSDAPSHITWHTYPPQKKSGNSHLPGSCRDSSTSSRLPNAKCHCRGATAAPVCGTCHMKDVDISWHFTSRSTLRSAIILFHSSCCMLQSPFQQQHKMEHRKTKIRLENIWQ